jgi:hypothetical protein
LACLPGITSDLAGRIVSVREDATFSGIEDLVQRIPELFELEALQYLSFNSAEPEALIAKATIHGSGASRSVRIIYSRDQRIQYLSMIPLVFRRVDEVQFGRWQFQ